MRLIVWLIGIVALTGCGNQPRNSPEKAESANRETHQSSAVVGEGEQSGDAVSGDEETETPEEEQGDSWDESEDGENVEDNL